MIAQASSAVSTNLNRSRSRALTTPSSTSASKLTTRCQNSLPNSTIGIGLILPVWISVNSSNISSNVPKPPGKTQTARVEQEVHLAQREIVELKAQRRGNETVRRLFVRQQIGRAPV